MGRLIDGKMISREIQDNIRKEVDSLISKGKRKPGLATLLVGDNPASQSYIRSKIRSSERAGFNSFHTSLPETASREDISDIIDRWNRDDNVDGILVQLPLPQHLIGETNEILLQIDPSKDVDGFHPVNIGNLVKGNPTFIPCTPRGIIEILKHEGIETTGKDIVVIGRSQIVGLPLAILFLLKGSFGDATVTVCHSRTRNLPEKTSRADILVAAIGKPHFVTEDMVKEGATVIDVGVNRVEDSTRERGYRLVGDVDTENVLKKVSAITPVPGGVGPMTITMLLLNTLEAYKKNITAV